MMLRNRTPILAGVFAVVAWLSVGNGQRGVTAFQPAFSFEMKGTALLPGLMKFGSENHIPIGIVLQPDDSLCQISKSLSLKDVPAGQIIDGILEGSDYAAGNVGEVWIIRPRSVPIGSNYLLNIHLEQFGTIKTTLQGIGIILAGYVRAHLRPNEGYAGDILASTSAEKVEPFTLHNVTVEQTANHIVTLAGKGVWILYPVPGDPQKMTAARHLYVYGYQEDAGVTARLSCTNPESTSDKKQ